MDSPSGVLALDPLPLGDLNRSGNLTATVCAFLHLNGKLLRLHVGSDEVHLVDLTEEVGVSALDVEGSGFVVHTDIIGTGSGGLGGRVDSPESGTRSVVGGCCDPIIRAQAKEGQGRPDDENGRHRTCLPVIIKKYKKREAIAPLFFMRT